MAIFTKDSLETLRQRIDLVDVLSGHIELKRSGAAYKGLCPFHDEKTPSFMIQKGDTHYHCFGCGAHGDAIQFLMNHLKISFLDAVENLAQRFNVPLQQVENGDDNQGPNKAILKDALEKACRFYHFYLMHTEEGQRALQYLFNRGLDLDFINTFEIGLAPKGLGIFRKIMHAQFVKDSSLIDAGLLAPSSSGGYRDFFYERITFPIRDAHGSVIGFSARKFNEDTFGGKYVNTSETALFKKSRVLYGLNYCRKRIAKERQAIVVEGQIDALRLIQSGFNFTVAAQGTAFGESHARELINLGVQQLYIAPDGDDAGLEAACKIGNLFQREGIDVSVLQLPKGADPDSFICEYGPEAFTALLKTALPYLDYLVKQRSRFLNVESPAGKNQLVHNIAKQIREWNPPLMVHESLRKLANLVQVPESSVGIGEQHVPNIYIKRTASAGGHIVDSDRILEFDFLRWLLTSKNQSNLLEAAKQHLNAEDLKVEMCRNIFQIYCSNHSLGKSCDPLSLAAELDDTEGIKVLSEILERKVNQERAELHFLETLQRLLDRNWMEKREAIKMKIQDGSCSEDEAMDLVRQFDELKRNPPKVPEDLFSVGVDKQ